MTPARPQAVASQLTLVSPPGQRVAIVNETPRIAVDATGRVMVVYHAIDPEGKVQLTSASGTGGAWANAVVPMPQTARSAPGLEALSAGPDDGTFHLLATTGGGLYYWVWRNGSWSAGELIQSASGGSVNAGLWFDAQGQVTIVRTSTRFHLWRKLAGKWTETTLPFSIAQQSVEPVYTDASGVPRLLATKRWVPLVATLPASADPWVATNWQSLPPGEATDWKCVIPPVSKRRVVLDWPHQTLFGAWVEGKVLSVAWAPVGATSEGQWRSAEVQMEEKTVGTQVRLVSNGRGGVGLVRCGTIEGTPQLVFHWLSAAGVGPALPILRPGTQTEASVFRTMAGDTVNFCIDDAGTAHLVVVGTKRGETPADMRRLFYATITGGGTATTGPEVEGHGTTEMDREGAPPDFTLRLVEPEAEGVLRLTPSGGRLAQVTPQIEITNQGAQYFGDLWVRATVGAAEVNVRIPDTSGHTAPLFLRDQKRKFTLPSIRYAAEPGGEAAAPPLSGDYPLEPDRVTLGTGLGRQMLTVTLDPDNAIEEADEANNAAAVEYVVADGRSEGDRERDPAGKLVRGLNDLAILAPPRLRSNTALIRSGYVQRPTQLDVVVTNPRLAGFFADAVLVVYLDDREIARETLPPLLRAPNLVSSSLGTMILYDRKPPKPDLSGAVFQFPVDLTSVAEGQHRLRVVVDPEDKFADLHRENNEAVLDFRVRPPGGVLRARVVDFTSGAAIGGASTWLTDLWAGRTSQEGYVEIADVPAGAYDGEALSAARCDQEPTFFEGHAPAFQITQGGRTDVTIRLEKAMTVLGSVTDATTGQPVTEPLEAFVCDEDGTFARGGGEPGGRYAIPNVPPGRHRVVVGAYGYRTREITGEIRRTPGTDECTLDITLEDGPRATLTGRVTEADGRALADALVCVEGAPRGAISGTDGSYRIERVAAGGGPSVWGMADDHTTASVAAPDTTAGAVVEVPTLVLRRVTSHLKSIDFSATTYAECEESPSIGPVKGFNVNVEFGKFTGALGLTYSVPAGTTDATVDNVIVWLEGGTFLSGGVTSSVSVSSLVGVDLDTLKVGPMKDLLTGYGRIFSAIDGVNKVAAFLSGPRDPNQLGSSGEVVANYVSQTGAEYKDKPFLDVPTSLDVPVGMTFAGGGNTIVRVDEIEITDGATSKTIRAEWYSPGFAAFGVGQDFDLSKLEVKLKVAVLNDRLQTGVLGQSSRNLISWKPSEDRWLRIQGFAYENTFGE